MIEERLDAIRCAAMCVRIQIRRLPWSNGLPLPTYMTARGEIRVPLINLRDEAFRVARGMRIAQLVVAPVVHVQWEEVDELPATIRGGSGFGHSGV